jgi:hypothetical protein
MRIKKFADDLKLSILQQRQLIFATAKIVHFTKYYSNQQSTYRVMRGAYAVICVHEMVKEFDLFLCVRVQLQHLIPAGQSSVTFNL